MKKVMLSALFVSAVMASAFTGVETSTNAATATAVVAAPAKGATFKLQPANSSMQWTGKKVTGEHTGAIKISKGDLTIDKNTVTGGSFEIDMNSITCTDLTDAEYNQKLIGHLKSDDFFSTAKYPKANFKITSITPIKKAAAGAPNYKVKGNLTIKGITNPIEFPATVTVKSGVATANADIVIDRTKWDVKYGSGSIFDNLGDKAIYDDINLKVNLVAKQ